MSKPQTDSPLISRRVFSAALAASPLVGTAAWAQSASAILGQPVPDFTAVDATGKSHKLSDFKGKTVVLEWTNPNCPFVKKHYMGNMQSLQKDAAAQGVVWLAINSTETGSADYLAPAKLTAWNAEKQATPAAMLMDESGKIGTLYGAKTTPHMYLIDPKGRLVYAGAIDSVPSARVDDIKTATNYVKQALTESMGGKPVTVATSRAYGCSIKYKA